MCAELKLKIPGKSKRLWLAVISVMALGWLPAWGLNPDRSIYQYNCQTWHKANGLPANAVTAIAQATDGHVWFGTSQGLVCFDGVGFRVVDLVAQDGAESKVIDTVARRSARWTLVWSRARPVWSV